MPALSLRDRVVIGQSRRRCTTVWCIGSRWIRLRPKQPDGTHLKIPQLAAVVIEDDVEIGANTTIDRPAVGETRIRAGTKIDNLVQIAHGVRIGYRIAAGGAGRHRRQHCRRKTTSRSADRSGSTATSASGTGAVASGKTGITGDIDAGVFVSGWSGGAESEWRKTQVLLRRLPEFKKKMRELERRPRRPGTATGRQP